MSVVLTSDKHKEAGDHYTAKYFEIIEKEIPEALEKGDGIAELQEKADSVYNLAQSEYDKWESLKELEGQKNDALQNPLEDNTPDPDEEAAKKAMKEWGGFKSGGHWLKTLYNLKKHGFVTESTSGLKFWDGDDGERARIQTVNSTKALAENTGATGGFLVPAEFRARMLSIMATQSVIRPRATIQRMNRRTLSMPVLNQEGTVTDSASWFGGVRLYYKDEATSLTDSTPNFREMTLTAHKLTGLMYSSEEMLADSAVALEDYLMGELGFPGAFAWRADFDYLRGDGVGKPEGILEADCLITTGGASGNAGRVAANDIQYEDLAAMLQRALPTANCIWVASQSTMAELLTMNGPSGNPSYLWGNSTSGIPNTLLGRPIFFTDKLPALGSTGDIMLIDPSYYIIGDRQALTIEMSIHNKFELEQATWRATMRHDGQMWLNAPITHQDTTTQVSPAVALGVFST